VNEPKWTSVFQTQDEIELRIKKIQLEDEGIPVMVFDQRDSSYNAFGYIYIEVLTEDVERARKVLNLEHE
jgi:hypothetical protein